MLVRIIGQPALTATVYELQKLRCHLCGEVFTAESPVEAGDRKYDATAGSIVQALATNLTPTSTSWSGRRLRGKCCTTMTPRSRSWH